MVNVRNSLYPALFVEPVELRTEPGVFAYDAWRNLSFGVWVGQATVSAVNRLLGMSAELAQRHPEGRSSVIYVLDQVQAPTPEAKELLKNIYAADGFACLGIVLEGTGFWASGIRSMASNVQLTASTSTVQRTASTGIVQRVCTTVDELVAWLPAVHLARTGVTLAPNDFRRALLWSREHCADRALHGEREPLP